MTTLINSYKLQWSSQIIIILCILCTQQTLAPFFWSPTTCILAPHLFFSQRTGVKPDAGSICIQLCHEECRRCWFDFRKGTFEGWIVESLMGWRHVGHAKTQISPRPTTETQLGISPPKLVGWSDSALGTSRTSRRFFFWGLDPSQFSEFTKSLRRFFWDPKLRKKQKTTKSQAYLSLKKTILL